MGAMIQQYKLEEDDLEQQGGRITFKSLKGDYDLLFIKSSGYYQRYSSNTQSGCLISSDEYFSGTTA
jgi:hypothetical protein